MTEAELAKLLTRNPELIVVDDGTRTVIGPIRDNGDRAQRAPAIHVNGVAKLSEHDMQKAIIEECDRRAVTNLAWAMVAACPNGQYRTGQRMEPGLRAGFPDLMVMLPRIRGNVQRYGLFLELKVKPNDLTPAQEWWLRRLRIEGYVCEVVYDDPQTAINILEWWIG